jgi:hypothetical protein
LRKIGLTAAEKDHHHLFYDSGGRFRELKVDRAVRRVPVVQAYTAQGKTIFVFECLHFRDENCAYETSMFYVCPVSNLEPVDRFSRNLE